MFFWRLLILIFALLAARFTLGMLGSSWIAYGSGALVALACWLLVIGNRVAVHPLHKRRRAERQY